MFCERCGNKLNDDANFCSVCGYAMNSTENINEIKQTSSNDNNDAVKYIGVALIIIGAIAELFSIIYIIECETGNSSFSNIMNYYYNDGRAIAITIAVFALILVLIGIRMKTAIK